MNPSEPYSTKALLLPPLSLYIHIPWCVRKCPYCDFNSHTFEGSIPESLYVDALLRDLDDELSLVQGRRLQSIFIGGGTPSLLSPESYVKLLQGIEARIDCHPSLEVTLEANPGTFEQARFSGFRQAGINRLSLGIQSFSDPQLKALGRIHSADDALQAAESALQLGFQSINLDLMHGLPGQTVGGALQDLKTAIQLAPQHLSWYQLTIESHTEFHRYPPQLPEDETLWEIQEQGFELLRTAGYRQYEISAFSQPGCQSRHNINYWEFGDYIGIGAGAHGKLTDLLNGQILRRSKQRQPKAYLEKSSPFCTTHRVTAEEMPLEFMMNALRLHEGVPDRYFAERTGLSLADIAKTLASAREKGLMKPSRIAPTPLGRRYLNDLLGLFL